MTNKFSSRFHRDRQIFTRPTLVSRDLGAIKILSGSNDKTPTEFLRRLQEARRGGFEELEIDVSALSKQGGGIYPNVVTPICALMHINKEKTDFLPVGSSTYMDHLGLFKPYPVISELSRQRNVLNKIWQFDSSEDTFRLTREFIDELYQTEVVDAEGVLAALEWCLGEVLENAILHSEAGLGFVMGQLHTTNKHVAFTIVDLGRGILESFTDTEYNPREPEDAITLAMEEGVTRNRSTNQGNGLWGLHNIIQENKGVLVIMSGGGGVKMSTKTNTKFGTVKYGFMGGGTIIDFQFDLKSPVSLEKVLGGYIPKPMMIVNNADDKGNIQFLLKDRKTGFGTREAGMRLRNEVFNFLNQTSGKIEIDFTGIAVVTSSFADELIGKLYLEVGPLAFNNRISLLNMNTTTEAIVNRAMVQRMRTGS